MGHESDIEQMGELLIEEGIVTHEELTRAIEASPRGEDEIARLLLGANPVRRRELAAFLAMDADVPAVDLDALPPAPEAVPLVPESVARKHECVPVARYDRILCVAKANILNRAAVIELRRITGLKVKVLKAEEAQVLARLDRLYGGGSARADLTLSLTAAAEAAPRTPSPEPEAAVDAIRVNREALAAYEAGGRAESRRIIDAWVRRYASAGPLAAEPVNGAAGR